MSGSEREWAAVGGSATGTAQAGREPAERAAEREARRSQLQAEKARIQREISNYPTPIAACDEQFNFLLEWYSQVRRALARLVEEEQGS